MGAVENVMAAVILMFVLVIGALLYMNNFAKDSGQTYSAKQTVYSDDRHINNLNNILRITEPRTGRNIGVLLADAVYYRNATPVIDNQTINVTLEMIKLMNMTYGNTKYYLEVKPRIIEVSMNFVIDGSPSLTDEREKLASHLKEIIFNVEKKLNETNQGYKDRNTEVIANVYVISKQANYENRCGLFNNLSDSRITCTILDSNALYLKNTTLNTSNVFINNSEFDLQSFLQYYNMTPPFGQFWITNFSRGSSGANEIDYYEADWGYGTAYTSHFNTKINLARLTIVFPMSDELSTSSISSTCFYMRKYGDWIVCSLCDNSCPVNRSLLSVQKGIQVALDNNHIINPIFSYGCDYDYFYEPDTHATANALSGWNKYDEDFDNTYVNRSYVRRFGRDESPTWCNDADQLTCPGCTDQSGNICFHPTCQQSIIDQMQLMANATNGKMINLENITTMDVDIRNTITENIDQYALTIGIRNITARREVVETTQPLPNGQLVDVKMWVYQN